MCVRARVCVCVCICMYMYVCMYLYISMYAYVCVCMLHTENILQCKKYRKIINNYVIPFYKLKWHTPIQSVLSGWRTAGSLRESVEEMRRWFVTPHSSCHCMSDICNKKKVQYILWRNVNRYKDYGGPAGGYLMWPKHVAAIVIAALNLCMVGLYFVRYEFYTE